MQGKVSFEAGGEVRREPEEFPQEGDFSLLFSLILYHSGVFCFGLVWFGFSHEDVLWRKHNFCF